MAINLSTYTKSVDFARKTLHATAGNLDVLTLPAHCKVLTIRAAGTGKVRIANTGSQDAAIGTDFFEIAIGGALTLKSAQLAVAPLRITGTVNADTVEFILESALDG